MHEVVLRARAARKNAQHTVAAARWRSLLSHQRAEAAARAAAAVAQRQGREAEMRAHLETAARHEARCVAVQRRMAPRTAQRSSATVHVHLGFADAESREAVLMLLRDLGEWEAGRLVDLPGEGVRFEMVSPDLALCETAVRDRLRLALHEIGAFADLVAVLATRPADG